MTFMNRRTALAAAAVVLLGWAGAGGSTTNAAQVPDTIRVALFLDLGSKYQSTTPVVTLVAAGRLGVAWTGGQGGIDYPAPGGVVRFAVDSYRAMLFETEDYQAALTTLKKVQASSKAGFVTKLSKKGKIVYQVSEGVYNTAAAAQAALSKFAGAAGGQITLTQPFVAGPLAVEAGPYASLAEAAAAAVQFGNAGFDAFVAAKPSPGGTAYAVRVGQAASAAEQAKLQAAAAAAGFSVQVPAADTPYVVVRDDVTYTLSAASSAPLYALSASGNVTLQADLQGESGIQVVERSKNKYRGSMQISVLNNNLALVNVVGLEPYLYSVVGAEVGASWPLEAQKAQAVAARSYALAGGVAYQIADVVDNTYSQAYNGLSSENANSTAGVQATAGEVMTYGGKIITAMFGASAGGVTADPLEYAGNIIPYYASAVKSPDDGIQAGKLDWYRVALDSGTVGYIRSDLLADRGQKNEAGLAMLTVTGDNVQVRPSPRVQTDVQPVASVNSGTLVLSLGKTPEYTNNSWVEGPFAPDKLLATINAKLSDKNKIQGPLRTLEVSETGASGRVIRLKANGTTVQLYGDSWRSALGGVKSTLFTIEETARATIVGADGASREVPDGTGALQVLGGDGAVRSADSAGGAMIVMNGAGQVRAMTASPQFIIQGTGFGHGLGMSQWGARGLAEQGYDYKSILQYYYKDIKFEKDGAS
ncbi:SpoIID/LytB domain-containing protein [Cohnella sp. 56]|uniref:SpoIID/LytB domain-containing protein n=1 Tax=Cohnella sp. 56 TaxID=3113722 RepID=UPI0030E92787